MSRINSLDPIFTGAILLSILLDQGTKRFLPGLLGDSTLPILGNILSLRLSTNTGVAFSFPIEGLFLKALTIILILVIAWYYHRYESLKDAVVVRLGYACILGGAISNGIDRVFFGQVTDFIALKYFAIFNVADIVIT